MATICPKCNLSVDPLRVFDRSKASGKEYIILRCPRERCGFNIDIEEYISKPLPPADKKKSSKKDGGGSFWRYDVGG